MHKAPHRIILITTMLVAVALGGCMSGEGLNLATVDRPARPAFALSDLRVSPTVADAGDTVHVRATVTNAGAAEEAVEVRLVAHPLASPGTTHTVRLAPGDSQDVAYTFTAETEGEHLVTVGFPWGETLPGALIRVHTPDVALRSFQFDHPEDQCTDRSEATLLLANRGPGNAQEVNVHVHVEASDGTVVSRRTAATGALPAGENATLTIPLTTPDACGEDDWYKVHVRVEPAYDDVIHWRSQWLRV